MTASFPEIAAACQQLPLNSIVDGELVAWSQGKLDFDVLLTRLNSGKRRAAVLAREKPAHLVVFDLLVLDDEDLRTESYDDRRARLETIAESWLPPLQLTPVTSDVEQAEAWFEDLVVTGIEGLIVKGGAQPYAGGERFWLKVKHRETQDVVLGAVIGPLSAPRQVVVGMVVDDELRIAGRSATLSTAASRQLGQLLRPPTGVHPWPTSIGGGALDKFNGRREQVALTLVDPVIAEISADSARTRGTFRHAVRFVRLRSDLESAMDEPAQPE